MSDTFDMLNGIDFFDWIRNKYNLPYLGELARRIVYKIKQRAEIFSPKNPVRYFISLPDKSKVVFVQQGYYKIIKGYDASHDYIATMGLSTCIAVVAWNKKTGDSGIIHMDARTSFAKLNTMLSELGSIDDLIVDVVGGRPINPIDGVRERAVVDVVERQIMQIYDYLTKGEFNIRHYDVWWVSGNISQDVKNIILDKNSGNLFLFKTV